MHRWTQARAALVVAVLMVAVGTIEATPWADAAPTEPVTEVLAGHTQDGAAIPCTPRADGIRVCHGTFGGPGDPDLRLSSFDDQPLAVFVTLPPAGTTSDADLPLIVQSHGWGMPPTGPEDAQYGGVTAVDWAAKGYVVVQLSARGWGDSCGTIASRHADPSACEHGYLRLADARYEIRDVQHTIGLLVDEGLVDPTRIGVTGESYGAGTSLALATLDDRVLQVDGSTAPWTSPAGTPLSIAAAAPLSGWTDLIYALMPNGRTLDDRITSDTDDFTPVGVWKQSVDNTLFLAGSVIGYYSPQGTDPESDITTWFEILGGGEPYDTPEAAFIIDQIARYHSPYYLLSGAYGVARQQPPPLFLAAGFTDAIFPGDEYVRYANLARSLYPDTPIEMLFYDGGHQRGQNKPADKALLRQRIEGFLDHYVGGNGPRPALDVTALTQTCPAAAPSDGPFRAPNWAGLHSGEVRHRSAAPQVVESAAGDPDVAAALDPIRGGLACTTVPAVDQGDGVATYRLPTVTGDGYTLLGSPTVTAEVTVTGEHSYLAARLFDVDPATGEQVLVTRGVYRIDPASPDGPVTFQLEPNGWHFAAGHIPKLELLGQDEPFLAPSVGRFSVTVTDLELRLPVRGTGATDPEPPITTVTPSTATSSLPATTVPGWGSTTSPVPTSSAPSTTMPPTTDRPATTGGHPDRVDTRPAAAPARPVTARPDYTG